MHCALFACSWLRTMAEYTVTSLLRSDASVQTTSRVTLEHLPNFINGNEMQMFIRTHGLAHQQSVQSHGPSRDAPALTGQPRSRSPRSRISRIQLTPGCKGIRMRRMIGVNGEVMADAPIAIKGGHARLRFLLLMAVLLRTASRWCLSQFVGRCLIWAFIASSCALVAGSRRLPS